MTERELRTNARAQSRPGLLLVDDDPLIIETLALVLEQDYILHTAGNRRQVKELLQKLDAVPSLALIDLGLPPTPHKPDEGFELINELLIRNPDIKILVLSGQGQKANIQHSLTLGAVDFIPKPCDIPLLRTRLSHQVMMLDAEQARGWGEPGGEDLIGKSRVVENLHVLIKQFADTPFPVLIQGESGSGKELVARYLHEQSPRNGCPFLTINCAAFTKELLDAQLFGHIKGAYTGAISSRPGFFEEAGDGSLFLDEIGDLPIDLQSKLLRVLENGEFYRLGETQPRLSHARIIAATNRDLREQVQGGAFRQDLYHRLSVLTINVPPLRDRERDCLLLLDHFRDLYAVGGQSFTLHPDAEQCLLAYPFPGNVRELRNIVIRLSAKYPGRTVRVEDLQNELETVIAIKQDSDLPADEELQRQLMEKGFRLDDTLNDWERRYITTALDLSGGNLSKAARLLGINRTTLYSRIQRLGIQAPE